MIKKFFCDEEGMGTVELVLIIAVLVSIALIFRNYVLDFVKKNLANVFNSAEQGVGVDTETVAPSQSQ